MAGRTGLRGKCAKEVFEVARPEDFDLADEETPVTDDEVTEMVEQIFAADDRVDNTYIEVTTENGVVYLEGAVGTQEESEMAESLLDNIEGIQYVVNNLQVLLSGFTAESLLGFPEEEEEFEDLEVLPADEDLVSEDFMEAIEEGKAYVPPNEPMFPTERADAAKRMRERRAEEEATGEAPDIL